MNVIYRFEFNVERDETLKYSCILRYTRKNKVREFEVTRAVISLEAAGDDGIVSIMYRTRYAKLEARGETEDATKDWYQAMHAAAWMAEDANKQILEAREKLIKETKARMIPKNFNVVYDLREEAKVTKFNKRKAVFKCVSHSFSCIDHFFFSHTNHEISFLFLIFRAGQKT